MATVTTTATSSQANRLHRQVPVRAVPTSSFTAPSWGGVRNDASSADDSCRCCQESGCSILSAGHGPSSASGNNGPKQCRDRRPDFLNLDWFAACPGRPRAQCTRGPASSSQFSYQNLSNGGSDSFGVIYTIPACAKKSRADYPQFAPRQLPHWAPRTCVRTGLSFELNPPPFRDIQSGCRVRCPRCLSQACNRRNSRGTDVRVVITSVMTAKPSWASRSRLGDAPCPPRSRRVALLRLVS